MGRRWLTRKVKYILKTKLPIGVQNMNLKSRVLMTTLIVTSLSSGSSIKYLLSQTG